jgi:hypothetical protein
MEFRKRVGMEVRKTINPAEVAWDELRAVMERDGWEILTIAIVHKRQDVVMELYPNALSDAEKMEVMLEVTVEAGEIIRKMRVQ